jgi:hypothetical protein
MEPALPGAATVVMVGGADRRSTRLYAFRLADGRTEAPGRGTTRPAALPVRLKILQRTAEAFTVQMPGGPFSAWALQLEREFDPARAWMVNRPRLDWHWPSAPEAGNTFRLIGRNLVRADLYRTRDPRRPVSLGGLMQGKTHLVARPVAGGVWRRIAVSAASAYEIRARLPARLPPGECELRAHNGLGGALGWSEPLRLRVSAAEPWPARVFRAEAFIRRAGGKVDEGLAAALAAVAANGGGVLQLGPRPYAITRPLILPPRTVLRGAGRQRTLLRLPTGDGPKPPYVAVMGDGEFAVEDLCIRGVHAPVLLAAPTIRAETFDEALLAADRFAERRCRNVVVRRCHLEQNLLWHADRRTDKDHIRRMEDYSLTRGQTAAKEQVTCLLFRGDDIEIEGNTVLGGGHAALLNRSSYVRAAGNILSAGAAGHALMFYSQLVWPPDFPKGGGAPIRGNFCHRLLIEDNEITARSERARNLLTVLYAGERIHIARNNIRRIAPNSDAEALLTHLWQARWERSAIRMRDALNAEIIDPRGELAPECLDGAALDIVAGRGAGQIRDIVRREGSTLAIDRPWTVEPDETSRVVFSAPAPHRQVTIVDNRIVSQSVNVILWGATSDVVVDGNYTADGPGITLWSVRLEKKQSVWGGAFFTQIVNNVVDRGWVAPAPRGQLLAAPQGIFFVGCRQASGGDTGYDCLGLIVRGNHATNNTGIGFRTTFKRGDDWDGTKPDPQTIDWRIREAGIVIERNLCTDSTVGVIVERGARAVVRANRARNVTIPAARPTATQVG